MEEVLLRGALMFWTKKGSPKGSAKGLPSFGVVLI